MDIQRLFKSLKDKGINVIAKSNSVVAGLIWGVEGVEKVPKLGEVLFYVVNGTRYGVKPKRGNKHDIDWYYKQLKMGMQGAKAYHAGLTQFLNTWIKKGELEVVFKGKATASVTSAKKLSSNEKCDALIDGLANGSINKDTFFKTITKEYNLTPDCVTATRWLIKEWGKEDIKNNNEWPIHFRKLYQEYGVKFLNNYLNDLLFNSRSELSGGSSEFILDGLYKKFIGNKVVASASVNEYGIIDKVSLTAIRNYLEKNNIEFDLKQNGRIYTFSFDCGKIILDDNNQKVKAFFNGKVKEAETMRELNDFFSNCKVVASVKLNEGVIDNVLLHELNLNADKKKEGDFTVWTLKAGKRDFANVKLNNITGLTRIETIYGKVLAHIITTYAEFRDVITKLISEKAISASPRKYLTSDLKEGEEYEEIDAFIRDVNSLTINGKKVFNAEKKGEDIVINLLLKHFETSDMDRLNELVEDKLEILFPITQKWMDADKGQTFGNKAKVGDIVLYTNDWTSQEFADYLLIERNSNIDYDDLCNELTTLYNILVKDCSELETNLFKVTADTVTVEVKETAEVNEENFEGLNEEHDRLMYIKVSPEKFLNLWKTSPEFNGNQIQKIIYGFKLASRTLGSKFENKGILIEYFYSKKYGKGYIRVEYEKDLFIIYVARSEDNGDIKVITRKMRKMIPTKNFNLLSTSVSSLAFERANLPPGFKPMWEEVTKSN